MRLAASFAYLVHLGDVLGLCFIGLTPCFLMYRETTLRYCSKPQASLQWSHVTAIPSFPTSSLLYYMKMIFSQSLQVFSMFLRLTRKTISPCQPSSCFCFPVLLFKSLHINAPPLNTTCRHVLLVARGAQGSCLCYE